MKIDNPAPAFAGMTPEIFRRLSHEYKRTNPHNLPELRRRQRTRFFRRSGVPEMVFSTRGGV